MRIESERPNLDEIVEALSGASSVEYGDLDVETICNRYREAGYEVTPDLVAFLESYRELTISWLYLGRSETGLEISVESALDVHPANVRYYAKVAGKGMVPVGMAFDTEDTVLLSVDGEIFIGGDGGLQRVGHGFIPSMTALVADNWNKAYLIES
ncbi:SUKH-3 domain-containing protein [Streptomyces sp. NPDC085639]|uniref:SUKH-3 domain-containing protein n=1 Tax=Streptomyces sp. NPDC085639 TaxID=3365734 RepID=UPI0037D93BF0